MKKISLLILSIISLNVLYAQDEKVEKTFKKENLFIGGGVQVAFGSNYTNFGLSPYFGYSVNRYLDVAVNLGFNYSSLRSSSNTTNKIRQTSLAPGAFVRLFPVDFIFLHAQMEHNFMYQSQKDAYRTTRDKFEGNSFLVGGGIARGRDKYNKSFYYISVMWDIGKSTYSPYKDNLGRAVPIIKAGYNIPLFQGRN